MTKLFTISGPTAGHSFDLKSEVTFIGRASENDIQIKDNSISRRHLKVTGRGARFLIEDLGSRNGTWIWGQPIKPGEEVELERGVPIAIGNVFVSLGERHSQDRLVAQHSIDISFQDTEEGRLLLYKDRRMTNREMLELICEVSTLLMQSLDISEICERIIDSLFSCLKRIDSALISLIDPDNGELREVIARSRNSKGNIKMNYSRTIVNRVIREGSAVMMSDTSQEGEDDLSESIEMMRIKSIMCVPLISKAGTRGVIYVHSVNVPYGFRKDDLHLFTCLSSPAALAIENALLYTKSRQTEESLRESEEKYRLLVENAIDAVIIVQDGVIKFANPCTSRISGYSKDELAQIPFVDLFHPQDRSTTIEMQKKILEGEHSSGAYSIRGITRQNEALWLQVNAVRITWGENPATLNLVRDTTQQKRLEEHALHAQKMESIGTLAGGIAHEFNNLLMGIQGNTSLMLLDTDTSHPHHRKLKGIERYVSNGAELAEQLLGFARGGKYEVKPTDLNELVSRSSEVFARSRKEIKVYGKYQEKIWALAADQRQIEQVLLNLYINAWQAMPGGGQLFLETKNLFLDEKDAAFFGAGVGAYVAVSVSDSGVGIDRENLSKIFDPFFTTKEIGKGVGLGLASVYGIVKNHGGFIDVKSEGGQGSTFTIYLPASATGALEGEEKQKEFLKGTETVLFVDDEEMIVEVGKDMLLSLGYNVITAKTGKDAIRVYGENMHGIDILILDIIMPDMDGGEVYDRIKQINPNAKVLLSSGYSINGKATQILARGGDGFIQKPFNLGDLSVKVRDILEH